MKRKTAILASRIFRPEASAATFHLSAVADGFNPQTTDVEVLTTKPPFHTQIPVEPENIKVSRFPVLRDKGGNVRGYIQYMSFDIPLFFRLLSTPGDMVVVQPPPTTGLIVALASKIRRRPYVYYADDLMTAALKTTNTPKAITNFVTKIEKYSLEHAEKIISVSDGVTDIIAELGVDTSKVVTVPHGTDTSVFNTQVPKTTQEQSPYFVYTGTMSEIHGAKIFLDAFKIFSKSYPEVKLYFIGQGTDKDILEKESKENNLNVVFKPLQQPEELAQWIRGCIASLASIVPNRGYDFAKATKIYTAAACGIPVIYAGVGASQELVDNNDLGYASPYDPASVAQTMEKAYQDYQDGLDQELSEERSQWVKDHASFKVLGKKINQVMTSVMPSK